MEEARKRGEALLTSGVIHNLKPDVQLLADLPLPLSQKYRHLMVGTMLKDNVSGDNKAQVLESLTRLVKALGILEKYGCNLTSPLRPKFWRSVKHANTVFRATVDSIQGGRQVLFLYGYTQQQSDGLSFPDDVAQPDREKVAAVTLEVMTLRTEIDALIKGTHPHPDIFKDYIPQFNIWKPQQDFTTTDDVAISAREAESGRKRLPPKVLPKPKLPAEFQATRSGPNNPSVLSTADQCNLCGDSATVVCSSCDGQSFCGSCDDLFHRHPTRSHHQREPKTAAEMCCICGISGAHTRCATCAQDLCRKCNDLFHSHPSRKGHSRMPLENAKVNSASSSAAAAWTCTFCAAVNGAQDSLCAACRCSGTPSNTEWQCKSCTVINQGSSVLCVVCDRPRLAPPPSVAAGVSGSGSGAGAEPTWDCQFCTFVNPSSTVACEMCRKAPGASPPPSKSSGPPKDLAPAPPRPKTRTFSNVRRQERMREDGLKLIQEIKEAEKRGISPEEVYAALRFCGGNTDPYRWHAAELPHLLDEICAAASSLDAGDRGLASTRAEAKLAWLATGGDAERAVARVLRDRKLKMTELHSLGFRDPRQCEEALRQSGGQVKGALSLLQRPLLDIFHVGIWSDRPETPLDPDHPDKERLCRRLLALHKLPSWGRCELTLSLLREPDVTYSLDDVVQAVRESHDRDFIRRVLNNECPCCFGVFPRRKMQSLTSCECSVCLECFTQHFTIAVRDKHIWDMVCPVCQKPDINDPEHLNGYFSTLDIQLRECLEADVYELFHKKLRDHTLRKDPNFLWCCHCGYGFINEGDQMKVTCLTCHKSFCAKCKKAWESQHQDLSCEQFQQWKRDNDPEYQRQGLAGYLMDNGITCPHCRFQYALTKGGCMHFSCTQCRYQFCSGCNNPYYTTGCRTELCDFPGLHAHHPRDCLFYLRDWEPERLQALLKRSGVDFNTEAPEGPRADACGVMEQKDEVGNADSPCGVPTQAGQAGLCDKHYREYLVSLINAHSLDPAPLYDTPNLIRACERYRVDVQRMPADEDENAYHARLLKKLMEVPLGEKVVRSATQQLHAT
ncbi:E3 ubiquitin-protein ligase RNF31-like [Stigmatopora argus]